MEPVLDEASFLNYCLASKLEYFTRSHKLETGFVSQNIVKMRSDFNSFHLCGHTKISSIELEPLYTA